MLVVDCIELLQVRPYHLNPNDPGSHPPLPILIENQAIACVEFVKWESLGQWGGLTDVDRLVGPEFPPRGRTALFRRRLVNQGIDERPMARSPL